MSTSSTASSFTALGWRRTAWFALLVAASVAFTLAFACAAPFAAFAVAAATTLNRRDGLVLIGAVWLANQVVGFAVLGYPATVDAAAWGVVLAAVAVATTLAARWADARFAGLRPLARVAVGFAAAFAVYEGSLFLVSVATPLGGVEDFTPAIVAYILALNAVAMVGLFALGRVAAATGFIPQAASPLAAAR